MIAVLYFARLREQIGISAEDVSPPDTINTVGALANWLRAQSAAHDAAFADPTAIKAAVNEHKANPDTPIRSGDEVAFFPPMTGG